MGKSKRLKQTRADQRVAPSVPVGRVGVVSPGQLAVDEDALDEQLRNMPSDALPFYGLAAYYLASSPIRDANQCLLASVLLMQTMRSFGIEANLVALELDVATSGGGTVRYGRRDPELDGTTVRGHIGLLTEEWFIDATASQFPEILAHGGVRPVGGHIGTRASILAQQGGQIQMKLSTGEPVLYTVHPVGSADGVGSEFLAIQPDKNALPVSVNNLATGFGAVLEGLRPGVATPYPALNARIRAAAGKTLENRDGVLHLVDDV